MAALTEKSAPPGVSTTLESRTITNLAATESHNGMVQVPAAADGCVFFLNVESAGGTTPLIDFGVYAVNPVTKDDSDMSLADSITQMTAAGQSHLVFDSFTMPRPWLGYRVTLDGTTADEDYTYQLYIYWHLKA